MPRKSRRIKEAEPFNLAGLVEEAPNEETLHPQDVFQLAKRMQREIIRLFNDASIPKMIYA